ncbi:hydroxyisourate hydrolase [Roseovarius mucosus]|jgi:5-hydroxyisourate hydrolase|uniref:5-hydroxyisourate hydrolase n=1 Tax=Roseovarius mucosus TaxID=215743 RepID=A0A1V0RQU5_9RHOB|nr:hydroxyisourate hydrolase [Roseovarius mucosus]ARE84101.1 5-hydroxyisourate hydrolase [Roseovarius mucosus]MBW4974584.1 hydroxyisourate hydrolase [Roseovarius mucosus]
MSGYLTTHVLDTARGCPAPGLLICLSRITDSGPVPLCERRTNADGRTDGPILTEADFAAGPYELLFHAGEYLRLMGVESGFLDLIPIRFSMTQAVHYHVPLLLSPYGYTTYRGS